MEFDIRDMKRDADEVRFEVHVPSELKYLEGHFPSDPIVPGVAQLLLVEDCARRAFSLAPPLECVRRLKFTAALRPDDLLTVQVTKQPERVRFVIEKQVEGETVKCSSGSLLFKAD